MVQAGKLDGDCVDALLRSDDQRQAIRLGHAAGGGLGGKPAARAGKSSIRSAHSPAWVSADEHCGFP